MTLGNKKMPLSKVILRLALYLSVYAICMLILYPYFVMLCTALKSRAEIFAVNGTVLPIEYMWSNFIDIWQKAPMAKYMLNSVMVAGGSTIIAMVCMVGVTGLEIAALIRYRKIPAAPTPASPTLGISSENTDVYDLFVPPSSTLPKEGGESYGVTEDEVVIVYEMPKDGK